MLQDRWEGEDEEEVKENWDDSDEEEEQKSESVVNLPKKKTLKQKIAEKEEEARLKKEEKLREKALADRVLTPEELLEEKLKGQRLQEESDLRLAIEAFGGNSAPIEVTGLDSAELNGKEAFDGFRRLLVKKLNSVHSNRSYAVFLEELFRDLSVPMDAEQLKSLSSSMTAMYNEKLRAQRVSICPNVIVVI
jgi:translation initiation factor 3 subunit J